jgi:Protein of unknown function (DUF4197)
MDMLSRSCRCLQIFLAVIFMLFSLNVYAGWRDFLDVFDKDEESVESTKDVLAGLSENDIVNGLKQALSKGTRSAVAMLGQEDGFLANPQVKIPMPESLKKVEKGLRKIGKDKLADNFIETMNRAAEKAVPEATSIFADTVKTMSIVDAKEILQGEDDAATQYFRENSGDKIKEKFLPIVKEATSQVGVTSSYKKMTDKLGFLSGYVDTSSLDLDDYVTNKAMDGLFTMVAAEEKKIRENPLERTTDLLKKVFSTAGLDK